MQHAASTDRPRHTIILRLISFGCFDNYFVEKEKLIFLPLLRRGKFYKFDIVSADETVQSPLGIRQCLEKIMEMAGGQDPP